MYIFIVKVNLFGHLDIGTWKVLLQYDDVTIVMAWYRFIHKLFYKKSYRLVGASSPPAPMISAAAHNLFALAVFDCY